MRTKALQAIKPRDASLNDAYVDLEPFYNFSLSEDIHDKPDNTISLPGGLSDFNGITFDARGVIQLASNVSLKNSHIEYPREITGIPVGQFAKKLCFLHSSAWASEKGSSVARIQVNYKHGHQRIIDIKNQIDVEDWWFHPKNSVIPAHTAVAWEGTNKRVEELGFSLKLYHYTWVNPDPGLKIVSIDLISSMNATAYMLFALTCL